jgi:hypothetical protein
VPQPAGARTIAACAKAAPARPSARVIDRLRTPEIGSMRLPSPRPR